MKMRSFRNSRSLVLALIVNFAVITSVSIVGRSPQLVPVDDVHFGHVLKHFLAHIISKASTEGGLKMTETNNDQHNNVSSKIDLHGYMNVVFRDAEDQLLLSDKDGNSAGGIILGITAIREINNNESTAQTFDLRSAKVNMDDVFAIELAFIGPNEIQKEAHIKLMDVGIDRMKPLKLPVTVHKSDNLKSECYHTVQLPWQSFQQWLKEDKYGRGLLTLHLHRSTLQTKLVRPLLVLYARIHQSPVSVKHPIRRVRTVNLPIGTCKRCVFAVRKRPFDGPISKPKHETCGLRQYYATLEDLRWDTWVIAPSGFYLNYCSGSCQEFIFDTTYNSTNNAVARSIILAGQLEDKRSDIPPPYCVPTKLRSTNIMYYENGHIIIKTMNNIIAEQCGCS